MLWGTFEEARETYDLGHVQNDDGGFETNTDTSNQTTSDNSAKGGTDFRTSEHLNDHTDEVDDAATDDGPFATDEICHITSDDGAEESTAGEDRDDQRLVRRSNTVGGVSVRTFDLADEDGGTEDTVDVTGVITEEDTTESSKSANQVGLPGDGSFDAVDIVGGLELDGARARLGGDRSLSLLVRHGW
jgi:hypothetical protein